MALFSRKKTAEENKEVAAPKTDSVNNSKVIDRDLSGVLLKPRITEKAVGQSDKNVYTFTVRRDATKYDVQDAIVKLFGVTPVKVNIVNKSPRQYMSRTRGRKISSKGMKKAYVYLKDGDSISFA